jgi:hypothetical protein
MRAVRAENASGSGPFWTLLGETRAGCRGGGARGGTPLPPYTPLARRRRRPALLLPARFRTTLARRSKPPLSPLVRPGPRREGGQPSPREKCPYESGAECTSGRRNRAWSADKCTQVDIRSAYRPGCGGVRSKAWRESTPRAPVVSTLASATSNSSRPGAEGGVPSPRCEKEKRGAGLGPPGEFRV